MNRKIKAGYFIVVIAWLTSFNSGRTQQFSGRLQDNANQEPIPNASILELNSGMTTVSNAEGLFTLDVPSSSDLIKLKILVPNYQSFTIQLDKLDWGNEVQTFYLNKAFEIEGQSSESSPAGDESDEEQNDVYALLSSSENPLLRVASFEWGAFRYRMRGLGSEWDQLGLNGFLLNDMDYARLPFYLFSGLTTVSKYSDDYLAFKDDQYDFGCAGVSQWITAYPSEYRKEFSVNLANTNRNYSHRLGVHYASGIKSNGLSWMAGMTRRWAQEAYVPGTFYDAWGAYLGISKSFRKKHQVNVLAIYAPTTRGKSSPGVKEVFDLSGDLYYNSYWGYQQGEKRNSREAHTTAPAIFMNYRWDILENLTLHAGIMGMYLNRYDSQLDWNNAPDPRPDYYQKLPSSTEDSIIAGSIRELWKTDVNTRQVDWKSIYEANYNNEVSLSGVNGDPHQQIQGNQAVYWLGKRVLQQKELEQFVKLSWFKGRHEWEIHARSEMAESTNSQEVYDLLGSDFVLDIEDFIDDPNTQHPDIVNKNKIVLKGDRYGYYYKTNTHSWSSYLSYRYFGRKLDFKLSGQWKELRYKRNGYWQNAIFNGSQGLSPVYKSIGYGIKGDLTWKINGRNYVQGLAAWQTLPNRLDQVFINPEWRPDVFEKTDRTQVLSLDIAYHFRSPRWKCILGFYWVDINDQILNKDFFLDEQLENASNSDLADGSLINAFYSGLSQRHQGIEMNIEYKLLAGMSVMSTAMIGDYFVTQRPDLFIYDKFSTAKSQHVVYIKNYPVYGSAQYAGSLAIKYDLFRNGFFILSANYLSSQYLEYNPLRRIPEAVSELDKNAAVYHRILDPEKLPSAVFLNLFAFKAFKLFDQSFIASFSVVNLLNNQDIINGGFEQFRFDYTTKNPDTFPSKYYYFPGINYYLSLTWRI